MSLFFVGDHGYLTSLVGFAPFKKEIESFFFPVVKVKRGRVAVLVG